MFLVAAAAAALEQRAMGVHCRLEGKAGMGLRQLFQVPVPHTAEEAAALVLLVLPGLAVRAAAARGHLQHYFLELMVARGQTVWEAAAEVRPTTHQTQPEPEAKADVAS